LPKTLRTFVAFLLLIVNRSVIRIKPIGRSTHRSAAVAIFDPLVVPLIFGHRLLIIYNGPNQSIGSVGRRGLAGLRYQRWDDGRWRRYPLSWSNSRSGEKG
jgi:hypothetical protein